MKWKINISKPFVVNQTRVFGSFYNGLCLLVVAKQQYDYIKLKCTSIYRLSKCGTYEWRHEPFIIQREKSHKYLKIKSQEWQVWFPISGPMFQMTQDLVRPRYFLTIETASWQWLLYEIHLEINIEKWMNMSSLDPVIWLSNVYEIWNKVKFFLENSLSKIWFFKKLLNILNQGNAKDWDFEYVYVG